MKRFIPAVILGIFTFAGWAFFVHATPASIYTGSAVRVEVGKHDIGTGVYIGAGVVITAAHMVLVDVAPVTEPKKGHAKPVPKPKHGKVKKADDEAPDPPKTLTHETITVITQDGTHLSATVVGTSEGEDVAVLHIEAPAKLQPSALACRSPVIGEPLEAVGNKLGFPFLHSWGRVSGTIMEIGLWKHGVPIDLTIAPGSSGGPVYDVDGRVLGIVVGFIAMGPAQVDIMVASSEVCDLLSEHK